MAPPVPVKVKVASEPEQTGLLLPEILAVGKGFTVTVPLIEAAIQGAVCPVVVIV